MASRYSSDYYSCFYKYFIYIFVASFVQIVFSQSALAKSGVEKYDTLIKSRNKDISALDNKLKAIGNEKIKLRNKQNQQIKLLDKINSEIDITGKIIRKLSDNKEGLKRDINGNQEAIVEEQERYDVLLKKVNIIMKNLYITQKEKNMLLLINYKEFHKLERGIIYNKYFYKKGVILLDSLKELELDLQHRGERLDLQVSEVDSIQKNTMNRKKKLNSTKIEKNQLVKKLKDNEKALELELEDIESEKKSIEIIIKTLEKKRKKALKSGKKIKIKKEYLIMPAKGKIVRKFGKYRDKKYKVILVNKGIDIKVGKDKNIRASAEGIVVKIGYFRNLKNYIIIEHSKGVYSFYSKLEHINVLEGDKVKRNSIIGNVKGSKTEIFHFEIRKGKNAVNPLKVIKR